MEPTTAINKKSSGGKSPGGAFALIGIALVGLITLGVMPRIRQHGELAVTAAEAHTESQSPSVEVVTLGAPPAALPAGAPVPPPPTGLTLPASIQAIEETNISARTSGYLRRRYTDIGARVKAGQLLAEIESPEIDQQLTQAQAQTAQSVAGTGEAQANVAKLQAGVEQSKADMLRMQAAVEQARAALARSKAKLIQSRATVAASKAKEAQAQQALEGRKADLAQTKAQLELDQKSFERWQDLGKQGAISQQEVDAKKSAYDARVASVNAGEAAIRAAEADIQAAQEATRASQSDVEAAQADVESSQQSIRAAQAQTASGKASVVAAQAGVTAGHQNVRAAQAQVGASTANVQHFAVLRSFEKVTAPFSGVITSRNVDNGALIAAGGSSLFGIARTDVLRILVNVPQSYVKSIHNGNTVQVMVREFPGKPFTGIVFSSAGALDSGTRTLLTEIHLQNTDGKLIPGMYAQVQFPLEKDKASSPLPRIPANTLMVGKEGTRVAVVSPEGMIHLVTIKLGRDLGTELEVMEGLRGDERLVTNPSDDLVEGTRVRIVTPAAPGAAPAGGAPEKK